MSRLVFISVLLFACSTDIIAGTYWIAPKSRRIAKGSQQDPFGSMDQALKRVGGGHTFIFKPGYYTGQITIRPQYAGTPKNPTILRSQYKYKAILNGSPGHMIYANEGCDWVIVDGFDISGAWYTGVKFGGDYSVVRNCRIHNNGLQGIEAHGKTGTIIEYNLIEYNGKNPQFDHGIYANGTRLVIRGNIVRFNASIGVHVSTAISDSIIENNLINENHKYGIWINSTPNGNPNRIINNTIVGNAYGICFVRANNDVVANNIIWSDKNLPPVIGFNRADISKVVIDNNLFTPAPKKKYGNSNITGNPDFLKAKQGVYYLKEDSLAIGKGSTRYFSGKDFFGRFRSADKPSDLGCYAFDPRLLTPQASEKMYLGWAFQAGGKVIPDLWRFPVKEDKE